MQIVKKCDNINKNKNMLKRICTFIKQISSVSIEVFHILKHVDNFHLSLKIPENKYEMAKNALHIWAIFYFIFKAIN